jgi:plasmid stabilization system protein ParE
MEEKIIISKRFRNNILKVYQYLLKEFSAKTAFNFLDRLEKRIEFIAKNPTAGKLSVKRKNVRSILFTPLTKFFTAIKTIPIKYFAYLICGRTKRKSLIDLQPFCS